MKEGFYEFVNPVIVESKGEQTGYEGCLSVRGKRGIVTRPMVVKVEYSDRKGKRKKLTARGFLRARYVMNWIIWTACFIPIALNGWNVQKIKRRGSTL